MLPLRPGKAKRLINTYTRHGTTCLLAALLVHEGTIEGRCFDRHIHEEFLHFTPTYASWLNQIEIWFGILARDVLRGGVWHSKQ